MKTQYKLILFFFLLPGFAAAQVTENYVAEHYWSLTHQKKHFGGIARKMLSNADVLEILNKLCYDSSVNFCQKKYSVEEFNSDFVLIDFDNDDDIDLVFNGYTNGESEDMILFENIRGMYQCRLHTYGRLVKMEKGKGFLIYQYPCCADIQNMFIYYSVQNDTLIEEWGLTFFNSFVLKDNTEDNKNIMPGHLKAGKYLMLEAGTKIYIVPSDTLMHPTYIKNPKLGTADKASKARVYGSFQDAKGDKWFYCRFDPDEIFPLNSNLRYPFFAWVKVK